MLGRGLDAAAGLVAADAGHHADRAGRSRPLDREQLERLLAGAREDDVVASSRSASASVVQVGRAVVDGEDLLRRRAGSPASAAAGARRCAASRAEPREDDARCPRPCARTRRRRRRARAARRRARSERGQQQAGRRAQRRVEAMRRMTVAPSMPGITPSTTIALGRWSAARRRPSSPLPATTRVAGGCERRA